MAKLEAKPAADEQAEKRKRDREKIRERWKRDSARRVAKNKSQHKQGHATAVHRAKATAAARIAATRDRLAAAREAVASNDVESASARFFHLDGFFRAHEDAKNAIVNSDDQGFLNAMNRMEASLQLNGISTAGIADYRR